MIEDFRHSGQSKNWCEVKKPDLAEAAVLNYTLPYVAQHFFYHGQLFVGKY